MVKKINKRGQSIAIWVILGIALIVSMVLFFSIERGPKGILGEDKEFNPERFISSCVKESVNDAVDLMLPHGGFIDDRNSISYNNINISYLCLNKGNYRSCISQHPVYLEDLKKEIIKFSKPKIENCFMSLKKEVEKNKGNFENTPIDLQAGFSTEKINIDIDTKIKIEKQENVQNFDGFNFEIVNPLYDLARVAMEISNEEAKNCYFEYVGYNILYPKIDIRKTTLNDGTKIYMIKDKKSGKELDIAIRGCAIPAGI